MKLRGFLLGLAGGVVGAVLVVLALVFVFDLGEVRQGETASAAETPAVYTRPSGEGLTPDQLYRDLSGGVVMVLADFSSGTDLFGRPLGGQSLGTGFVVDEEGYILTNAHVVQNDSGQTAGSVTVVFNKGGSETERVKGELVGVDPSVDVAVIKVDPDDQSLKALPVGDSDDVVVGEPVVAIGNPLGYDFSITAGIVSATGRSLQAPNGMTIPNGIQTDAAINQGNSGGPLINGRGQVIGINEQIATRSGGNEGLGFAVPINSAMRSLEEIRETGQVQYAWLGVIGQTLSSDVAAMFDITTDGGALVEQVAPDSPAEEAALRGGSRSVSVQGQDYTLGGDIIVAADGSEIRTFDDLIAFLAGKRPGDKVTLTIERDGRTQDVEVTLAARPSGM
jgi:putative serine protease PepD